VHVGTEFAAEAFAALAPSERAVEGELLWCLRFEGTLTLAAGQMQAEAK
jgi:hypothetical protein